MFRRLLIISAVVLAACERKPVAPLLEGELVAKVNGVSVRGVDSQALDEVVQEELQAQRALELGYVSEDLDANARRHSLAKQFRMAELFDKATVSPEEVSAWFLTNTERVQSEFTLQFIKVQGKDTGEAVLRALASGKSFDEVAAAQFPRAVDPRPWAAQSMSWFQVPPPWWGELDQLTPAQTSGLIADQNDRYWIVKLLERKQDPEMTFEVAAPAIAASLKAKKFEARRDEAMGELRAKAKIEITRAASPGP